MRGVLTKKLTSIAPTKNTLAIVSPSLKKKGRGNTNVIAKIIAAVIQSPPPPRERLAEGV